MINKIEVVLKKFSNEEWDSFLLVRKINAKNKYIFSIKQPNYKAWKDCFSDIQKAAVMNNSPASYKLILMCTYNENLMLSTLLLRLWKMFRKILRGERLG